MACLVSLKVFLAGTRKLSYYVRYSDKVEKDEISLSRGCLPDDPEILTFWYGVGIAGMEFIHLDSLLMKFRV